MTGGAASSLGVLLERLVDYAGLFPPAELAMPAAVAAFAGYRDSPDAWALGRFIVPIARLDEMMAAIEATDRAGAPWALSVLAGDDAEADANRLATFTAGHGALCSIDAVEMRASSAEGIARAARAFPSHVVYVEVPVAEPNAALLQEVERAGLRAKIRTGGVTADAFPAVAHVAAFIVRCAALELPFKATAGLHHPVRSTHSLTYASDAPRAPMFGFLNVFMGAAIARAGAPVDVVEAVLLEQDAGAFRFDAAAAAWRSERISLDALRTTRSVLATSFGSCSFREPIDDLHSLGLL